MIITHKLQPMDLTSPGVTQRVDMVQDDKYSRNLEFTLTQNGSDWAIPDGTVAMVRYKKSDGTGGNYDILPDGTPACTVSSNVLTVALAPQVCTAPGLVQLVVGLILGDAEINTFAVNIIVQPNPGVNAVSEDYTRLSFVEQLVQIGEGIADRAGEYAATAESAASAAMEAEANGMKSAENAAAAAAEAASHASAIKAAVSAAKTSEANANQAKTSAQQSATAAVASARQAADSAAAAAETAKSVNADEIQKEIELRGNKLAVDSNTGLLYLMSDEQRLGDGIDTGTGFDAVMMDGAGYLHIMLGGEDVVEPVYIGTGGGGGGSAVSYQVSLKNLLDSRTVVAAENHPVHLRFSYSSVDKEGNDDGAGIGTVTVNGVKKATVNIPQGENTIDIQKYVTSGSNTVKLKVENSEGTSRTLSYTVTVMALSMTTTMDEMALYSGDVIFNYTVTGSGEKTVHFLMDGEEIGSEKVSSSGRSRSYKIAAQSAGGHILTAYAEVTVDDTVVRSNALTLGMMFIDESMNAPEILSTFTAQEATRGEILTVPWMVYDPLSEAATVTRSVLNPDGSVYSVQTITADRSPQEWVVQDYPAGAVVFRLSCRDAILDLTVAVAESAITTDPVTDALALCFDPTGRSNQEDAPASWTDGNVTATFQNIGFSGADGWLTDSDGASVLRILPGGTMTIPFKLFESDARASGATVEVEMATHNVRDYDSVVISCLSGGRGFKIASQYAQITSEQSRVSMQFREDEKVRLSFVVEPRNFHRLVYVYVNGIMCGAIQYPTSDNFAQTPAVGITLGAESSGIDIYRIRLYTKGLTRQEVLDNFIADRPVLAERMDAAKRNDILDPAGNMVISKLPVTLPYMIMECQELPQYKGDKKTCNITYVNPADQTRSFTAVAEIDVQGTSSAGYKKKNFKIKLKNGLTYTASGETAEKYLMRPDSIPATVFCMKADVASSEGTNNVELAKLYNDLVPWKTPAQEADSRVRVGIDGLPCVIFWQNGDETRFWGKYNFNFDKGAEEVFGLTDGCESWEILNNTSSRVLFQSADFSGTDWQDDFEARYPDGNTDSTNLKAMCQWVASTDRSAVSTQAEKNARLQKFKDEFEDHFIKAPMLFYYLFTEIFLMVDSRAKNFFPTTFDGTHWFPLPYDFDTAIGINNEGQLAFDYDLEDTDTVDGNKVFNGQDSALWCNIRDAFPEELKAMYNTLRSGNVFNYAEVTRRFAEHQAVWPETVWNEDAWEKYLEPLENDNDGSYLAMLQGDKSSQRGWWLFNGFRFRDSKYQCGDASGNFITLRCYAVGDITVTPYSHIWPRIKYGSYTVTRRGKRNVSATMACPLDTMNDTEVYIYSADRLADIGDLSPLQVGYANFSMAGKLQSLKLGDGANGYQNTRLTELYVGNNELLAMLDVRNCINLTMTVDLSGCAGVETVRANGSAITGVTLPVGGKVKRLELPRTVTNLTVREQAQFETLDMEDYSSLTTLRLENTPNIPVEAILNGAGSLDRVRLIGMEWTAESEETLRASINLLKGCIGMDASGNNTPSAVVTGRVHVPSISAELLTEINDYFPQLVVVVNGVAQYVVRYIDYNNTKLYRAVVPEGGSVIDPVAESIIEAPTREGSDDTCYTFADFGELPTDVHGNVTLAARYVATYRVRFFNEGTVHDIQWVESGSNAATPAEPTKASTDLYRYTFSHWDADYSSITAPLDVNAVYISVLIPKYTVRFMNGTTVLQTVYNVPEGGTAVYTGATPESGVEGDVFTGWYPSNTNIQSNTDCQAVYSNPYALDGKSWAEISAISEAGTAENYFSVGDCKAITLNGTVGTLALENVVLYAYILGFNHNAALEGQGIHFGAFKTARTGGKDVALVDAGYGSYKTDGTMTFNMNHWGESNFGGWTGCDLRYDILGSTDVAPSGYGAAKSSGTVGYDATETCATNPVANTLMAALPADLRAVMKPMIKYSDNKGGGKGHVEANVTATIDYLPLLGETEIFGAVSGLCNSAENTRQEQYAYYAAGNSKVKYRHSSISTATTWWERSAYYDVNNSFCRVTSSGNVTNHTANASCGLAPAFKV